MKDPRLSRREQRILDGIEEQLRGDESIDRELRTMRARHKEAPVPGRAGAGSLRLLTTLLLGVCLVLFAAASATGSRLLLWSFSAVWVATAPCLLVLMARRVRRVTSSRPTAEDGREV
jgi:Flp pilus assembly protein TadB